MSEVTCSALNAGSLTLPEKLFVSPASDSRITVPSMSFLIVHADARTNKHTRVLWDLGMRRNLQWYPANLQKYLENREPLNTRPDVVSSLNAGGLGPDDIDYVIFSHLHYDHIGYPRDFTNPHTKFVVGPGSLALLDGSSPLGGPKHFFEPDLLDLNRTVEISGAGTQSTQSSTRAPDDASSDGIRLTWNASVGPFSHAVDLFDDESVFVFSAPGHLPGHLSVLVRVKSDRYVCLAGDACHDVRLFTGECEIAQWTDEATGLTRCAHHDLPTAKKTIAGLASFQSDGVDIGGKHYAVDVVLAHDLTWEAEAKAKGKFFPGKV